MRRGRKNIEEVKCAAPITITPGDNDNQGDSGVDFDPTINIAKPPPSRKTDPRARQLRHKRHKRPESQKK